MADNETVQGLIALANNAGASMEERRTAAFQAVTIMHKRNLSGESGKVSVDAEWHEFERRMLRSQLQSTYVGALSKVTSALEPEIGAASGATGYAELSQLCWGLARVMGDVVLTPSLVDADVAQVEGSLRFVVAAFKDWQSRQQPVDLEQVRSAITALFDAEPTPEPSRAAGVSIAARLHVPVESVQTALEAMISEGLLRCKGGSYSKAKRPRKAKAANG